MSKKILIVFGFLFLILFIGSVSAEDICWGEASSADCITNNGQVVMSLSDPTNAHGALAGQGTFARVLCCNFGAGDTTCTGDNKIIGLSSSTNAHAEAPNLASPNYAVSACYDSFKDCRSVDEGFNCGVGEIEVVYISSNEAQLYTNAHIEEAGLQSQNYDSKICCVGELLMQCDLTSAEWQYEEVMEGTDTGAIVNGTDCEGLEISLEVFRGSTSCDDIAGCENPSNVVFGAGTNSVTGTWSAGPVHDNEYSFVVEVVANPDESVPSSEPDILVIAECPYDPEPVVCSDYTDESHCNSNICGIDVQDGVPSSVDCSDPGITCECIWDDNECKGSWDAEDIIYHTECIDNMCVGVSGPGVNECSPIGSSCNIIDPNFNVCLGPACVLELGVGEYQCNESEHCIGQPESHTECIDNMCVGVSGPGVSECLPIGGACDLPSESHSICVNQMCMLKEGPGENQCSSNADCGEPSLVVGKCVYTQSTSDTCDDDGLLTFSWTAQFVWAEGMGPEDDIKGLHLTCVDGQKTVECPAQIPLPFFNIYSFVATLIIIALIYVILILKKEKRKKQ